MSFLGLEGLHVFITGAAGGIATAAVKEFLGRAVIAVRIKAASDRCLQLLGVALQLLTEDRSKFPSYAQDPISHLGCSPRKAI